MGKIKLKLTTLARIFIHVVCRAVFLYKDVILLPYANRRLTGKTCTVSSCPSPNRQLYCCLVLLQWKWSRYSPAYVHYGGKYRHCSGNRHYSAYCHCWLFLSVPRDFTGTIAGNRHYRGTTTVFTGPCGGQKMALLHIYIFFAVVYRCAVSVERGQRGWSGVRRGGVGGVFYVSWCCS